MCVVARSEVVSAAVRSPCPALRRAAISAARFNGEQFRARNSNCRASCVYVRSTTYTHIPIHVIYVYIHILCVYTCMCSDREGDKKREREREIMGE